MWTLRVQEICSSQKIEDMSQQYQLRMDSYFAPLVSCSLLWQRSYKHVNSPVQELAARKEMKTCPNSGKFLWTTILSLQDRDLYFGSVFLNIWTLRIQEICSSQKIENLSQQCQLRMESYSALQGRVLILVAFLWTCEPSVFKSLSAR